MKFIAMQMKEEDTDTTYNWYEFPFIMISTNYK